MRRKNILVWLLISGLLSVGIASLLGRPTLPANVDAAPLPERLQVVSSRLRCQVCQGQSVWESDSRAAWEMRDEALELLQQGLSTEGVLDSFVDRYGPWILMQPPLGGFHFFAWFVPVFLALGGGGFVVLHRRGHDSLPVGKTDTGEDADISGTGCDASGREIRSAEDTKDLDERLKEYL